MPSTIDLSACRPAAAAVGIGQAANPAQALQQTLCTYGQCQRCCSWRKRPGAARLSAGRLRSFDIRRGLARSGTTSWRGHFHLHHRGVARIWLWLSDQGLPADPGPCCSASVSAAPAPQGRTPTRSCATWQNWPSARLWCTKSTVSAGFSACRRWRSAENSSPSEYARGDKLHVPVSSLNLISRYTGTRRAHRYTGSAATSGRRHAKEGRRKGARRGAELLDIYAPGAPGRTPCPPRTTTIASSRRFRVRGDAGPAERDRCHRRRHGLAKTDGSRGLR